MRYWILCHHAISGPLRWERITIGDNYDAGVDDLPTARLVGARLLGNPAITAYRICDSTAGDAVIEEHPTP